MTKSVWCGNSKEENGIMDCRQRFKLRKGFQKSYSKFFPCTELSRTIFSQ